MPIELVQRTLDGALDGASYALVGLGLTLSFGVLRRLNLAYGAGAMLAAYLGAWAFARFGLPWWAVAAIVVAAAGLIGLYVEWLCFAANREPATGAGAFDGAPAGIDSREVVALASSFAIWMQLEQLAVNLLPRHLNPFPSLAAQGEWALGGLVLRGDRLALALLAVALTFGLAHWLHKSRGGLAWRATAQQRTAAALAGMAVPRVQRIAFATACAVSGLAAFAVLAIEGQVTPMFGMWVLIKGLVAAMLGGLGSIRGVLAGGLLLGIVEVHAQAAFGAVGREFATYALLFVVLVWPRAVAPAHRGPAHAA
jgi:branched-chain amino acid transport system permease protein